MSTLQEAAMTAERAEFFLRRFKSEEMMLGPNEQAAIDFAIAALTQQGEQQPVAVSDAMVEAYLTAQRKTVEEADRFGRPNAGGLHTNTVREACRNGISAALAAAAAPQAQDFQEWWNSLPCDPSYQEAFAAGKAAAPAPQPSDLSHLATIAGLESSIRHLSALFNEQLLLLEEVEKKLGVDGIGNELNDGECVLIDRIREHLAAMALPKRSAPHSQDLLLNRLLNIADGVRMYGAPDKDLLADRLVAIASELANGQASQQVQVKPEFQAEVDAMTTAAEVRKAAVTGTLTPNSIYNGLN